MRCSKIQRNLSRFIDNEITVLQKKEIENHLVNCKNCQRVYLGMLQSWKLLNVLPNPEQPPFLYTRIRARLLEQAGAKSRGWMERILVPLSATVAVILGIVIGSIVGANGPVPDHVSIAENNVTSSIDLNTFDDMPESSLGQIYYEFTGLQE